MKPLFITQIYYLFFTLLFSLLVACGGSSSPKQDPLPNVENIDPHQNKQQASVILSTDTLEYELQAPPEFILIRAQFSESVESISVNDLQISHANINHINFLGSNEYGFSITPDGSGHPVNVFLSENSVSMQSGIKNKKSNMLTITGVDTIAPEAHLDVDITAYRDDFTVAEATITLSLSEDTSDLSESVFSIKNIDIVNIEKVTDKTYQILITTIIGDNHEIWIPAAAFEDLSGNSNTASNIITISKNPAEPIAVDTLKVHALHRALQFNWNPTPNTAFYQLKEISPKYPAGKVIGHSITNDAHLSFTLSISSLTSLTSAQYFVQSCNSSSCVDGQAVSITEALWRAATYIKAPKWFEEHAFGYSINLSNDGKIMAVSAINDGMKDINPQGEQSPSYYRSGAVYLYQKQQNNWQFLQFLQSPEREAGGTFGTSISLSGNGDIIAIGAPTETEKRHSNAGSVYVFRKQASQWILDKKLVAPSILTNAYFGHDLSIDEAGQTLAIGAYNQNHNNLSRVGQVYLFQHTNNNWAVQRQLSPSNAREGAGFGYQLALAANGKALVVGAPFDTLNDDRGLWHGSAYVYRQTGEQWQENAHLSIGQHSSRSYFGRQVSIDKEGKIISISAESLYGTNGSDDAGAVFVYTHGENGSFKHSQTLRADNMVNFLEFGQGLAMSSDGQRIVVSASEYSLLPNGFYQEHSPNNTRPVAYGSGLYVFQKQDNGLFETLSFIKNGWSYRKNALAMDATGNTIAVGAYDDRKEVSGVSSIGEVEDNEVEVADSDRKNLIGSVFIF